MRRALGYLATAALGVLVGLAIAPKAYIENPSEFEFDWRVETLSPFGPASVPYIRPGLDPNLRPRVHELPFNPRSVYVWVYAGDVDEALIESFINGFVEPHEVLRISLDPVCLHGSVYENSPHCQAMFEMMNDAAYGWMDDDDRWLT
jgi:hypothetical protein